MNKQAFARVGAGMALMLVAASMLAPRCHGGIWSSRFSRTVKRGGMPRLPHRACGLPFPDQYEAWAVEAGLSGESG